jgi:hypothetical protein
LAFAQGAARLNQLVLSQHARERANQRAVTARDIRSAVLTAKVATWDGEQGTWQLTGGTDTDGDALTVVVAIEGNKVRLVTEF